MNLNPITPDQQHGLCKLVAVIWSYLQPLIMNVES